ncbi:MAG: carboxypeptidase-like regulatory domain-containing protein, partial [Acidobacteria bacterium]|nr:carboxypeptidase-like regulatory domain-containing protein [Acidobacteriota bacterium]
MRRTGNICIIFIILLACSSMLFAQGSGNGLVVEVTDAAGRPLKNACVTVIPREGEITFRKADKQGRVRLKEIAPGSYRVVVKVDGFTAQKRQVTIGNTPET